MKMMKRAASKRFAALVVLGAMLFALAAPQASAAGDKQTYTITRVETTEDADSTWKAVYTVEETVSYQEGGTTVTVHRTETTLFTNQDRHVYEVTGTYKLSKPLTKAARNGEWNTVLDVPAGTVVTYTGNYQNSVYYADGTKDENGWSVSDLEWLTVKRVITVDETEEYNWHRTSEVLSSDYGESLTVQKNTMYQLISEGEETKEVQGGFVFRGV